MNLLKFRSKSKSLALEQLLNKAKGTYVMLCLAFLSPVSVLGQNEVVTIPPSPDAGHLGTYGELTVSKATGAADISIPIISLQEGGISIPITLSYQSAGLRVDERPSWVGMGWILSTGGVITRTMRGRCDDLHYGFLENLFAIPNASIIESDLNLPDYRDEVYDRLDLMQLNGIDYIPDAFSFNFGGRGGSFFFGNDANVHCKEHASLKFEPIFGENEPVAGSAIIIIGWIITDDNGLVYKFLDTETTSIRTRDNFEQTYISSWYLSSIYNPITETTATFIYDDNYYEYHYEDETTSFSYEKGISDATYSQSSGSPSTSTQYVTHGSVKFLSNITLNNNSIDFLTSSSSEGFRKLDLIQWSNGTSNRNFSLEYDYFPSLCNPSDNSPECYRLKLKSFSETDLNDTKSYDFKYYSGDVPKKKDYGQDHWGFYNGQNNSSLVPNVTYGTQELGGGANREPSFDNTQIGMLSKITYPTKGSTSFFYEQNTWEDVATNEEVVEYTVFEPLDVTANSAGVVCAPIQFIALREGGDGEIEPSKNYRFVYQCRLVENTNYGPDDPILTITEVETSTVIRTHYIQTPVEDYVIEENELTPGYTYKFELCATGENNETQHAIVDITLEEVDPSQIGQPIARLTGGLRLSRKENRDLVSGNIETRTYDYGYGGYNVWKLPIYNRFYSTSEGGSVQIISSSPTGGLGLSSLPIAYQKVNEWFGNTSTNTGRVETIFKYSKDVGASLTLQESRHSIRTKIDIQNYYDGNGKLVKSEDFEYDSKNVGSIVGFIAKKQTTSAIRNYSDDFNYANFTLTAYWYQLISKTTTDYTFSDSLSSTITYEYGSNLHTNPTREIIVNSKGETLYKEYTYPIQNTGLVYDCYVNYLDELNSCSDLTILHALEASSCRSKWDACYSTWRSCYSNAEPNCIIPNSVTCYRKPYKACGETFEACLAQEGGYYSCLNDLGIQQEYEKCQKAAFVNYKLCQNSFEEGLLSEYENETNANRKAILLLNVANIQSKPIEIKSLNESSLLTNMFEEYYIPNGVQKPLLKSTSISYQDEAPVLLVTINKHDSKGNPLEVQDRKDGFLKSYIWGYNQTYPVAQIINASYDDVLEVLGTDNMNLLNGNSLSDNQILAMIDDLRNDPVMLDAQVTTYAYKPGIGVSCIVDPNGFKMEYFYDDFGRLIRILKDGKILRDFEYNFKN